MKILAYPSEIASQMLDFYNNLSDKDPRHYAAIEATKRGSAGATYIHSILQCDDRTITHEVNDLNPGLSHESFRIRQLGTG